MAICEFHDRYVEFLTDKVALELVGKKGLHDRDFGEIWCVVKNIAICKTLEQITPGEAKNLTSVIYKLYPQYEERIKQELANP